MKKVLLLPFLSIPSGHHQAADTIAEYIRLIDADVRCEKLDILSYGFGTVESFISQFYLKWIHWIPGSYSWIYKNAAYRDAHRERRYLIYEILFLRLMQKLISDTTPDLIVCTHCLPSRLASLLKSRRLLSAPVVNVYTDFFINAVWGCEGIDYHFVPDLHMKQALITKGVAGARIFITGIPVHPHITESNNDRTAKGGRITALLTGGSQGAGMMKALIGKTRPDGNIHYKVLCGKNNRLFSHLIHENYPHVTPIPYIESKAQMNDLYDEADVILTKPGGITVSECIRKGKPIVVYHALPGQEEINLQYLRSLGIVIDWFDWHKEDIEEKITRILSDRNVAGGLQSNLSHYKSQMADREMLSAIRHVFNHS
ncbi:MGDG synthase family glycosyltransferase [Paenibacillus alkalitolerans]|uniref:MGDG synthase family glycosyltransferase n=1 Tax=Paenibacillus alkalitolerans TaxID=2799335 RepID=UPI002D7F2146|nr:glycosyltransferase [Paenibacillus alkalitolerans]